MSSECSEKCFSIVLLNKHYIRYMIYKFPPITNALQTIQCYRSINSVYYDYPVSFPRFAFLLQETSWASSLSHNIVHVVAYSVCYQLLPRSEIPGGSFLPLRMILQWHYVIKTPSFANNKLLKKCTSKVENDNQYISYFYWGSNILPGRQKVQQGKRQKLAI